jgi:Ring finger domain
VVTASGFIQTVEEGSIEAVPGLENELGNTGIHSGDGPGDEERGASSGRNVAAADYGLDESLFADDEFLSLVRLPSNSESIVNGSRSVPSVCAICLCQYGVGDTVTWSTESACQHAFHRDCVIPWLSKKDEPKCPVCRQDFCRAAVISVPNISGNETTGGGLPAVIGFRTTSTTAEEEVNVAIENFTRALAMTRFYSAAGRNDANAHAATRILELTHLSLQERYAAVMHQRHRNDLDAAAVIATAATGQQQEGNADIEEGAGAESLSDAPNTAVTEAVENEATTSSQEMGSSATTEHNPLGVGDGETAVDSESQFSHDDDHAEEGAGINAAGTNDGARSRALGNIAEDGDQ